MRKLKFREISNTFKVIKVTHSRSIIQIHPRIFVCVYLLQGHWSYNVSHCPFQMGIINNSLVYTHYNTYFKKGKNVECKKRKCNWRKNWLEEKHASMVFWIQCCRQVTVRHVGQSKHVYRSTQVFPCRSSYIIFSGPCILLSSSI